MHLVKDSIFSINIVRVRQIFVRIQFTGENRNTSLCDVSLNFIYIGINVTLGLGLKIYVDLIYVISIAWFHHFFWRVRDLSYLPINTRGKETSYSIQFDYPIRTKRALTIPTVKIRGKLSLILFWPWSWLQFSTCILRSVLICIYIGFVLDHWNNLLSYRYSWFLHRFLRSWCWFQLSV